MHLRNQKKFLKNETQKFTLGVFVLRGFCLGGFVGGFMSGGFLSGGFLSKNLVVQCLNRSKVNCAMQQSLIKSMMQSNITQPYR